MRTRLESRPIASRASGRSAFIRILGVIAVLSTIPSGTISADAIVVTKAMTASTVVEIFIEHSEVRVELEIGTSDLMAFQNLLPDEVRAQMGLEEKPLKTRLVSFFNDDFAIRADDGPPLAGRVSEIRPRRRVPRDEITGGPLPAPEGAGEPVVFVVLSYPFSGRPDTFAFQPPTAGGEYPTATIGFITYHLGLPVMDYRYLGTESTIDLNWDDPWFSKFRNRNLWRQYDSPINVFLYVEPFEVRVEIVARPRDVQKWEDVGIAGLTSIPVSLQEDVKQRVADFFSRNLDLTIDGSPVQPQLDRVNFLERNLRTSTVISPPRDLDAAAATLGVIFLQPTTEYPDQAEVAWRLFPENVARIPAAATDEAGPLRFFLVPDDNVLWWKNVLKNPSVPTLVEIAAPPSFLLRTAGWISWALAVILGVLLVRNAIGLVQKQTPLRHLAATVVVFIIVAGAAAATTRSIKITNERAGAIVTALLHNVYRAFDFRAEGTIYDTLDQSVDGDLLEDIYLDTQKRLQLASQGGARAKVQELELIDIEAGREGPGFNAICTWNLAASVGHWGHIHQRRNRYTARLTVQPIDGVWKISGLELIEEERL